VSDRVLPDAADRERALDLSRHALVMAPAGSGKTGLLVHRLLRALAVVDKPEQVVAITFTNKAAAEIRARVLEVLRAAQDGIDAHDPHEKALRLSARAVLDRDARLDWQLLAQPARLNALTIDAFCAQIGAQLPLLSGLGGGIAIAEDPRGLYLDAIARLFEEIEDASVPAADRDALARVLRLSGNRLDRLVEPLSAMLARREQWMGAAASTDEDWDAQDERALASLIEPALDALHRCIDEADQRALIDLLRDGAGHAEPLAWAASLGAWPGPDAEGLALLRRIADTLLTADEKIERRHLRKPKGVNKTSGFLPQLPYTLGFKSLLESRQGDEAFVHALRGVLSAPDFALPEELRALRTAWLRVLRRLAAHLRVAFAESQQADFPQLAQSALQALRPGGGVGDALLAADRSIRHLLVDEMQDTSETQLRLLESLTAAWTPGDGRSLFLVGDPQQSIYAFRKAEVRLFLRMWDEQRLGALPLTRLRLTANFRSQPTVVGWFNDAFERIFPRVTDPLRGAVPFASSVALRDADGEGGIEVAVHDDVDAEARAVAGEAARRLAPGRTVAVLARARSHLQPIIRALREQGLTPACQDIDPLAALPEVRDLFALARALWHPEDRLAWAVLLRAPFVGLSWAQMLELSRGRAGQPWPARITAALDEGALDADGRARLRRLQDALDATAAQRSLRAELADRTEAMWMRLGGPMGCTRAALDDVRQGLRCLREETRGGSIRDPERLERRLAELYAAPREGQVQLMTVHKAKGLEFDHVLLAGLNRTVPGELRPPLHLLDLPAATLLVPRPDEAWPPEHPARESSTRAFECLHALYSEARRNEGYRLLYVAITRARRTATLHLTAERDALTGAAKLKAHSFAAMLEPVIRAHIDTVVEREATRPVEPTSTGDTTRLAMPPRTPRLRADVQVPPETGLYQPIEVRTLRPSEAVLAAQEEPVEKRDEGDLYAQLVGTLYHEAMQRIAGEGLDAWRDAGDSRRGSMAAGLRRRGMPEPRVEPAVARVIELLSRTLASDQGRWLVSPKAWSRSEYPLAGLRDGRWISAVIDRCFEDEQGRLWVVDYKTRAEALIAHEHESYVAQGVERYRAQVTQYVELLRALRPGREVRGALYFVDADRLVEVS
jgi:ATP-dependent exoDNAse (exonuclease V) beta subunit